jgi:hypothetical protein
MSDNLVTYGPHPHIARLLKQYARDLGQITPSSDLDARIGALVATGRKNFSEQQFARTPGTGRRRPRHAFRYAVAAGIAALAIGVGILIGVKLERSRELTAGTLAPAHEAAFRSADLTMWPTDSVSFKIPAEYSAQGTLVAVDPNTQNTSTRYWIDVVVSNDGTFRIEKIVPAVPQKQGGQNGVSPKIQ